MSAEMKTFLPDWAVNDDDHRNAAAAMAASERLILIPAIINQHAGCKEILEIFRRF